MPQGICRKRHAGSVLTDNKGRGGMTSAFWRRGGHPKQMIEILSYPQEDLELRSLGGQPIGDQPVGIGHTTVALSLSSVIYDQSEIGQASFEAHESGEIKKSVRRRGGGFVNPSRILKFNVGGQRSKTCVRLCVDRAT